MKKLFCLVTFTASWLAAGQNTDASVAALDNAYPGFGSGFISAARWIDIVTADAGLATP
jgi:hypothetical protein